MTDTVRINDPVKIDHSSKESVAFELYKRIRGDRPEEQDKQLELFARCLLTVYNPRAGLEAVKKAVKGE